MPLNLLYRAALGARNLACARGWVRAQRLRWPVVSIGNISVGGSGKTPLVMRLAELLSAEGVAVDVLSRGYGREGRATEFVDMEGEAQRFGDEPMLIARRTGVPVVVGSRRYEAGRLAETRLQDDARAVHLLDDGFQHRQLARTVDVVVVCQSDFGDLLLPAGRLREPLSSLRRASVIVLRSEEESLESRLRRSGIDTPIWWVQRRVEIEPLPRAIAFCGIAVPDEFLSGLDRAGVEVMDRCIFRDHHRFTLSDIDRIAALARKSDARSFVTTEKDAVRLGGELRASLERVAPLHVARLILTLCDEQAVLRDLLILIKNGMPTQGSSSSSI